MLAVCLAASVKRVCKRTSHKGTGAYEPDLFRGYVETYCGKITVSRSRPCRKRRLHTKTDSAAWLSYYWRHMRPSSHDSTFQRAIQNVEPYRHIPWEFRLTVAVLNPSMCRKLHKQIGGNLVIKVYVGRNPRKISDTLQNRSAVNRNRRLSGMCFWRDLCNPCVVPRKSDDVGSSPASGAFTTATLPWSLPSGGSVATDTQGNLGSTVRVCSARRLWCSNGFLPTGRYWTALTSAQDAICPRTEE